MLVIRSTLGFTRRQDRSVNVRLDRLLAQVRSGVLVGFGATSDRLRILSLVVSQRRKRLRPSVNIIYAAATLPPVVLHQPTKPQEQAIVSLDVLYNVSPISGSPTRIVITRLCSRILLRKVI